MRPVVRASKQFGEFRASIGGCVWGLFFPVALQRTLSLVFLFI
jgi:hypothetical protein